ncbi:methyl-accepting chemotaxis protein [Bremerella cremea]|uniref:methyl-accepting chemotaxis protein n=1 Tax=Bremerella cremea TaxID=1031537 RepID=UPI0031ED3E9C
MTIRRQLQLLLIVTIFPLFLFAWWQVKGNWDTYVSASRTPEIVDVTNYLGDLTHELQKERGMSAGFLASKGSAFSSELKDQRLLTDKVIAELPNVLALGERHRLITAEDATRINQAVDDVKKARLDVNAMSPAPPILATYTGCINQNLNQAIRCSESVTDGELVRILIAAQSLAFAKEFAGLERARVSQALGSKKADKKLRHTIAELKRAQEEHLRHFDSLVSSELREMLANAAQAEHAQRAAEISGIVVASNDSDQFHINPSEWWRVQTARLGDYRAIQMEQGNQIKTRASEIANSAFFKFLSMLLISGSVLLAGIGLGLYSTHSITSGTKKLVHAIRDIATGKASFDTRLPEGDHELGQIATSFNQVLERLTEAGKICAGSATTLAASGEQLTAEAESIKRDLTKSRDRSEVITKDVARMFEKIQEASSSIRSVTNSLTDASSSIQNLVNVMENATQHANEVSSATQSASKIVSDNSNNFDRLVTAASEIGDVVGLIKQIAEQTNLLSLNATIEASRAGEAGKGFAVVATEVKDLANQTASAIQTVEQRIAAIQQTTRISTESTKQVVSLFENLLGTTNELAELTAQQGRSAASLCSEVEGVVRRSTEARASMDSSVEETDAINRELASIDSLLEDSVHGIMNTYDASLALSELACNMKEKMDGMLFADAVPLAVKPDFEHLREEMNHREEHSTDEPRQANDSAEEEHPSQEPVLV